MKKREYKLSLNERPTARVDRSTGNAELIDGRMRS
jgi:hypothetical protein